MKLVEEPQPRSAPSWPAFWGGYRGEFRLARADLADRMPLEGLRRQSEVLGERNKRSFKIDISRHEHVGDAAREHQLPSGTIVYVYSDRLLVAEKLRALCQQMPEYQHGHRSPRARDYFDIARLLAARPEVRPDAEFARLLSRVFAAKEVPLSWISRLGDEAVVAFHRQDFVERVRATVSASFVLAPFEHYVEQVVIFARSIPIDGR